MRPLTKKIIIFSALIGFVLSVIGNACSDARLRAPKKEVQVVSSVGGFCLSEPVKSKKYTKFLFVIDKSGSNGDTDPHNEMRADKIERFYNKNSDNQFIKWGYLAFHDPPGAEAYIKSTDGSPIFSNDPAAMPAALALQRQADGGGTPYRAALTTARDLIRRDLELTQETEDSTYLVFFESDGMPTDGDISGDISIVKDMLDLAPDKVIVSTAYYGPPNPVLAGGLQEMADAGKGKFFDTNTDGDFEIEDLFVTGESKELLALKSLIVYNVNSAICFDKTIGMDSDGDGLCDVDEIALGKPYDPANRFSFGDNFGDYFHYLASKTGAPLKTCDKPEGKTDVDLDLLDFCEESILVNLSAKVPLGQSNSNPKSPDSDLDGIIDGIEYFMLHDSSAPLDRLNIFRQYDSDPEDAYLQIMKHRNPLQKDADLPEAQVYDTHWEFTGLNAQGQRCYSFDQKHFQTFPTLELKKENTSNEAYAHKAGENVALIYYIQSPENNPLGKATYRYSFQKITDGTSGGLKVEDSIFQELPIEAVKEGAH